MRTLLRFILLASVSFFLSVTVLAQPANPNGDGRYGPPVQAVPAVQSVAHSTATVPQIVTVPIEPTRRSDGATMYAAYCSACHGAAGRGDGPAARALTQPVPDLTRISQRDGGFDRLHVYSHIADPTMHTGMPDWQDALSSLYSDHRARLALFNLERYVQTLQVAR